MIYSEFACWWIMHVPRVRPHARRGQPHAGARIACFPAAPRLMEPRHWGVASRSERTGLRINMLGREAMVRGEGGTRSGETNGAALPCQPGGRPGAVGLKMPGCGSFNG